CHRSPAAYGRLYASQSQRYNQGPAMLLACSGDTTTNIFVNSAGVGSPQFNDGMQLDNMPPAQFVSRIVATGGGNDIGFGDVAKECVMAIASPCHANHPPDASGLDDVDHRILNVEGQLVQY